MRFVGIDIAAETHVAAMVDEQGGILVKATPFTEDAAGYQALFKLLGEPAATLVAMEATGHYWQNLFAALAAQGFAIALLNPVRTRRFAQEDLARTKTDAIDAVGIARFAAQKRPPATPLPESVTQELRELVRLHDRFKQMFGDRTRHLHRLVDLGFPEFKRCVKELDSQLATTILHAYPTAAAFQKVTVKRLAGLCYDARHGVGDALARTILDAAKRSVGQHHAPAYQIQVRYACEDLDLLRRRLKDLEHDIDRTLQRHDVGTLLTTIDGIGVPTAARLVAELGDLSQFRDAAALAAYVGVIPALSQSGKRRPQRAGITPIGHARLRAALWMPTLSAVRFNPWLKAFYEGLRARGKLPKVALMAAMHKLLLAVFSVAKNRRPFVPHLRAAEAIA